MQSERKSITSEGTFLLWTKWLLSTSMSWRGVLKVLDLNTHYTRMLPESSTQTNRIRSYLSCLVSFVLVFVAWRVFFSFLGVFLLFYHQILKKIFLDSPNSIWSDSLQAGVSFHYKINHIVPAIIVVTFYNVLIFRLSVRSF